MEGKFDSEVDSKELKEKTEDLIKNVKFFEDKFEIFLKNVAFFTRRLTSLRISDQAADILVDDRVFCLAMLTNSGLYFRILENIGFKIDEVFEEKLFLIEEFEVDGLV